VICFACLVLSKLLVLSFLLSGGFGLVSYGPESSISEFVLFVL